VPILDGQLHCREWNMNDLSDPTIGAATVALGGVEDLVDAVALVDGAPDEAALAGTPEQGAQTVESAAEALSAVAPPVPAIPPVVLRKRLVRGRYRARTDAWLLELRVDVDGARTTKRISADFFSVSGRTTTYFGSFIVDAPTISIGATTVSIQGTGSFTWPASLPLVRVTIPRVSILQPPEPATLQFLNAASAPGASYVCAFSSTSFRTLNYEQDSVVGAVPFVSYDTGSLPQPPGSPARVLTVQGAFAEAGIELLTSGATNVIPVGTAGPTWSDSELQAAMVNHFSLFANVPQWAVWMLVASAHDGGYRGIMFDYSDSFQRQGAAVFYDAIQGTDGASQRAQLRTYVHEIGHAFNLLHSWQKNLATPPAPLGPNNGFGDLSWMNYAQNYQGPTGQSGTAAYWADFPFQFTDNELVHLRHGAYRNVVMGGNPFLTGSADVDPELFELPIIDNSGLALELRTDRPAFAYGEPVVVELKLSATDLRGRDTHGHLHPNDDLVTIAVRQPSGRTVAFRPLLRHCVDEETRLRLDAAHPAIYDSAYIGFGRDGFLFDVPGQYVLRASYLADDGSRVTSPVLKLRVRPPAGAADEHVGQLMLGDEQGQLLALLGSDSPALAAGREEFEILISEHGDHPLAVYARLARGVNEQRDFKHLSADKVLTVRSARNDESAALLAEVERASRADGDGVDNITLNFVMRAHARAEARTGDLDKANQVMDNMVKLFEKKKLNAHVLQTIRQQAEATTSALTAEVGQGDGETGAAGGRAKKR
jgi:hypothetical protein